MLIRWATEATKKSLLPVIIHSMAIAIALIFFPCIYLRLYYVMSRQLKAAPTPVVYTEPIFQRCKYFGIYKQISFILLIRSHEHFVEIVTTAGDNSSDLDIYKT